MNSLGLPILTLLIFVPALGGAAALLIDRRRAVVAKAVALVVALVELGLAVVMLAAMPAGASAPGEMQLVERVGWIPSLGVDYHLGVDGISGLLIALTALLTLLAVAGSWSAMGDRTKEYTACLLFLTTGVVGAFAALDLVLFFVFWEVMLIPVYLLVGICGGPRRAHAAVKFFIYTAVGSLVMLVGIISLYFVHQSQTGVATFSLPDLLTMPVPPEAQLWLFLAFALAFAIKVPVFPFHTWLPTLYSQAPIAALALVTMLVKVGAYGFLRFCLPLFPEAALWLAPAVSVLAVVGVIYGGIVAAVQRDIVILMAYSSLAHLGFVVLGIFALNTPGASGAVLQMINHGISTGAMFLLVAMVYARTRTTSLDALGGLAGRWPVLTGLFLLAVLSSAGLPGLNGFVGEFLVLWGAFQSQPAFAVAASLGIVVAAVYLLSLFRRMMHGTPSPELATVPGSRDLSAREVLVLVPLVILIVGIGLYPSPLLVRLEPSVGAALAPAQMARRTLALSSERTASATLLSPLGAAGSVGASLASTVGARFIAPAGGGGRDESRPNGATDGAAAARGGGR